MTRDELRCEYKVDPLGIDACRPRLSWQTPAEPRGSRQSAYRIVVARSAAALEAGGEVLWDSGKVASERSVNVPYAGRELGSGERCWWRVRTWDREGRAGAWSDLAGIRATAPGFREVAIEPQVVGDLGWAQARVRTIRGEIAVHWRRRDNAFELDLTIPGNVTTSPCRNSA